MKYLEKLFKIKWYMMFPYNIIIYNSIWSKSELIKFNQSSRVGSPLQLLNSSSSNINRVFAYCLVYYLVY